MLVLRYFWVNNLKKFLLLLYFLLTLSGLVNEVCVLACSHNLTVKRAIVTWRALLALNVSCHFTVVWLCSIPPFRNPLTVLDISFVIYGKP